MSVKPLVPLEVSLHDGLDMEKLATVITKILMEIEQYNKL